MTDHLNSDRRSLNMAAIHAEDTGPEMAVRKIVHSLGYRYRLHDPNLPGKPDLVFPSRQKALFVHGCFWHRHTGCKRATIPKTRTDFWQTKLLANATRDRHVRYQLRKMGWKVLTVWQCELKKPARLMERLNEFLAD
ncbi:very short patch repair endonuclease [Paracidobacterium acidisoli]|uniref:very short patch repair endonuclease n=1 Tax=Paracidobacterium acidisoli TaxID=2303751 RepID=UPI0033154539